MAELDKSSAVALGPNDAADSASGAKPEAKKDGDKGGEVEIADLLNLDEQDKFWDRYDRSEPENDRSLSEPESKTEDEPDGESEGESEEEDKGEGETEDKEGAEEESEDETDALDERIETPAQKRIRQLTARAKKAEERLKQLEAELAKFKAQPESDLEAPANKELQEKIKKAEAEIDAADRLLDKLEDDPEAVYEALKKAFPDAKLEEDEKAIRRWLKQYQRRHEQELIDAKAELAASSKALEIRREEEKKTIDEYASQQFSWLEDKSDPRRKVAAEVFQRWPEIARHPIGLLAAGLIAEHYVASAKQQAKLTKQPPKSKKPKPTPGSGLSGGATAREKSVDEDIQSRVVKAVERGSESDLMELYENI